MSERKRSSKVNDDSLEYVKINHKNTTEELSSDVYISLTSNLLKSFTILEDHIGSEINTFFNVLLPESKENDQLKINTLIASKSKVDNICLENYLNDILNRPESKYVLLTKELSEQLSAIVKEIYKKISKKKNIKSYEQVVEESKKIFENNTYNDILKKYRIQRTNTNTKISNENNSMILINDNIQLNTEPPLKELKSSKILNRGKNFYGKSKTLEKNDNELYYKFKKLKDDNSYNLPVEMLILIRKFSLVKKLKLVLNTETNSEENECSFTFNNNSNTANNTSNFSNDSVLEKNDVQNNILIFLNLEWLFPNVVEIEVDLTCDTLTEYLINNVYAHNLRVFSEIFKKDIKLSILPINSNNKRNYEATPKFFFSNINNNIKEEEYSSDKFSTTMFSNSINMSQTNNGNQIPNNINTSFLSQEGKTHKTLDIFFKKYSSVLEMIIIYGYFIQKKMSNSIRAKFILPLDLGDEISNFLKKQNVIIENFHFFSFIKNQNILYTTIDFNSLDSQTFEKVLGFLNKNQQLNNCTINFFPPEEYFKTEILLKTLQNCDYDYKIRKNNIYGNYSFNANILVDILPNEDLDKYILRKLSKYFETNLSNFFDLLTIKTCITELSLFFDIPTILIRNGIYNNILLKFFMNLLIFINNSLNNIKTLLIIAENFIFDSRKYPILYDYLENLKFNDTNQEFKLLNLCFLVKMFNINNIHKILSYNLVYLSIGAFDYITFKSFVAFFTSENFRKKSDLLKVKITLNNTVFETNKVYDDIVKLFTKFPKKVDEISLYSSLFITYEQIKDLLLMTNYNQLVNIIMQFNIKSIYNNKNLEELLESDLINTESDSGITMENLFDLYRIKRNKNITNKLINLMINLKKINPGIINYNLYSNIEKFLCDIDKKNFIIKFK